MDFTLCGREKHGQEHGFGNTPEEVTDEKHQIKLSKHDSDGTSKKEKHKKKKHRHREENSSSDSTDSVIGEWVEKDASESPATTTTTNECGDAKHEKLERDSWMTFPSAFVPTVSRGELRTQAGHRRCSNKQREEETRKQALENPGQHERELNPYWKDGGTGLPTREQSRTNESATSSQSTTSVGDGGYRWLKRAYERAKEQAEEENRSLEEVVAERWGSLEDLEKLLEEASRKTTTDVQWNRHRGSRSFGHRNTNGRPRHFHRPEEASESEDTRKYERRANLSLRGTDRFVAPCENDDDVRRPSPCWLSGGFASSSSQPKWKKPEAVTAAKIHLPAEPVEEVKRERVLEKTFNREDTCPGPQRHLTEKELNAIGAKIVKAELMGNNELASQLKAQLDKAKEFNKQQQSKAGSNREEVVIVTRPQASSSRPTKRQKMETHDADGQRVRFFADDDKYSLKQMFQREKMETAEDQNAIFTRLAAKSAGTSAADFDLDDSFAVRASYLDNESKEDELLQRRALNEHKKSSAAVDNCRVCFNGNRIPKHLIVAIGAHCYLTLPSYKSLTEGHCLIIPMQHVAASTYLDEDVWSEIQVFRNSLTKMFEEMDKDVVYFETNKQLKWFPHMILHCVPLSRDVGHLAPMYFKKAILESEIEWSNNKKLVDLSQKDVRRAIPKGLPYFSVNFGSGGGGFAHVIEEEKLFPHSFAQEILGGLMDLDPNLWRKQQYESFEEQRKKSLQFAEWWKPFDCTSKLPQ